MRRRIWVVVSVIVAFAALVMGALLMRGVVTPPTGVLVIAFGLLPVALPLAAAPGRRRKVGALYVAAGALFAVAGCVLVARNDFLDLRLAMIGLRVLARSGHALAPVGLIAIGVALALTGTAMLRARRSPAVLAALLVILTSGYFAGSLAVFPYLWGRRHGYAVIDGLAVAVAIVLALVDLLVVIAALSRFPASWTVRLPDPAVSVLPDHAVRRHRSIEPARRWVKPAVWALGVAAVAGIAVGAWLVVGPRVDLAEAFPDPNLATCVAHEMGVRGLAPKVSRNALADVRSLNCNGDLAEPPATHSAASSGALETQDRARIRSIRGLEDLPNLASLDLTSNEVSDLAPLADLQVLASIKLTHNQVSDLTPLAGLPVLSNLGLSDNAVTDLTPLAHVATLRSLGLATNRVSDLAPLHALTGLSTLDVPENQISDLTPLAGLRSLGTLDASENRISDLTPLADLTQVSRLTLKGNAIVSPAPLAKLPALTMLNIARNRIADAATFAGFVNLEELWIGGNQLTDITPLASLPALLGVDITGLTQGPTIGVDVLEARNIRVGSGANGN